VTATLSGRDLADGIRAEVAGQAAQLTAAGRPPRLAVVVATADGGLVGDVDARSVTGRVAGLTPVPAGVGPVTTALLLQHTVASAARGAGRDRR
jgi:methylenetetrahydrofolate dehydrogenase (NADP+)/methenyltetrahydrofolate cyclohydrolase